MAPVLQGKAPQRTIQLVITNRTNRDLGIGSCADANADGTDATKATEEKTLPLSVPAKACATLSLDVQSAGPAGRHKNLVIAVHSGPRDELTLCLSLGRSSKATRGCLGDARKEEDATVPSPWTYEVLGTDDHPSGINTPGKTGSSSTRLAALYQTTSRSRVNLLLFSPRDPASFLASVPDSAPLSALCLPGTHESLALYGWPISTCQSSEASVPWQLSGGIRYLDVRLAPKGDKGKERLLAYHGITDERIEFGEVLRQCWAFLGPGSAGQHETIVMSIKQESGDQPTFIHTLFDRYVDSSPDGGRARWFLQNRIPTLGEARGKIVMLSRFVIDPTYGYPGGISPPIWPNSYKGIFEYKLKSGQTVRTQDWYDVGSLSSLGDKEVLIETLCSQGGTDPAALALNYCNGSSFPLALPPAVAKGFLGSDGSAAAAAAHTAPYKAHLLAVTQPLAVQGVNVRVRDFVAGTLHAQGRNGTAAAVPTKSAMHAENAAESTRRRHLNDRFVTNGTVATATPTAAVEGLRVTFALDYYSFVPDLVPLLIEANF